MMPIGGPNGARPDRPLDRVSARSFTDYLNALGQRWKLVVAVCAAFIAAAVVYSLASTEQYDATSKLVLRQEPINRLLDPDATPEASDEERALRTNVDLITEETVARRVRERLDLRVGLGSLLDKVKTETETSSDIVSIVARDERPATAAEIANAFAEEYADFRRESARARFIEAAALARTQLERLDPVARESEEGRALAAKLRELEIAAALQTGGVEIVRPASVPTEVASPRPVRYALIAGFIGLLLGVALALALEVTDRRIKDEELAEELFRAPLLATVPRPRRRHSKLRPGDDPGEHEAYATLATNLRFFKLGPELRKLVVTSAGPGEGKSSVTIGLARALAGLGHRVVVIEADLRHPVLRRYLSLPGWTGLTSILTGARSFHDELIELDAKTLEPVEGGGGDGRPTLSVLPAGPIPPNPQALLGSPSMRDVIQEAALSADAVLIDTPPVATVNDAVTLVDVVDGALVVVRLASTTRDALARAMRTLTNLELPVLGFVATNATPPSGRYYAPEADRAAAARAASTAR